MASSMSGMTLGSVIVGILLLFIAAAAARIGSHSASKRNLSFRGNGKFKVAVFADLHYGENAWELWGPEQDRKSDSVMSHILDAEKPGEFSYSEVPVRNLLTSQPYCAFLFSDLVIYLGDLVTANNVATKNATEYWRQGTAPTAQRNIPWASVFGNHDDMAFEWPSEWFGPSGVPGTSQVNYTYFQGTTRAELMASEEKETMSITSRGPRSLWPSVSNFFLNISSSTKPGSAAAIFYFLDSGGGSYPEVISASQDAWFQKLSTDINPHKKIPEIAFWHIPSKAYESVAPKPHTTISSPCVGSINLETVASQSAEWGIMDVLEKRTSVKAVIVGHNHGLDWCCPKGSLWLCFARHTGYGGYGNWARGARVIELSEDPMEAKTWIRLEDGSVLSSFQLSTLDHSAH